MKVSASFILGRGGGEVGGGGMGGGSVCACEGGSGGRGLEG